VSKKKSDPPSKPEVRAVSRNPSGDPEAGFPNATSIEASGKLVSLCIANGLTVVSSQPNEVVCEVKIGAVKSFFAQLLLGNAYSTTPQALVRFTIAQVGANAIVQAKGWVETQMAFGQIRRMDLTNGHDLDNLFTFMIQAGAVALKDLPPSSSHTPAQPVQNSPSTSIADEIAKLAALRDKGILTEAEFQTQKSTLLRR
jgi:hypothetical protein